MIKWGVYMARMVRKSTSRFVDDDEKKMLKRKRTDMRRLMSGVSISTVGKVYITASSGDMRREARRIAHGESPVKRAGRVVRYVNRELLRESGDTAMRNSMLRKKRQAIKDSDDESVTA